MSFRFRWMEVKRVGGTFPLIWQKVELLLDLALLVSLFKNTSCMSSLVSINGIFWEARVMQVGVIGLWPWAVFKQSIYLVKGPLAVHSLLLAIFLGGGPSQLWPETRAGSLVTPQKFPYTGFGKSWSSKSDDCSSFKCGPNGWVGGGIYLSPTCLPTCGLTCQRRRKRWCLWSSFSSSLFPTPQSSHRDCLATWGATLTTLYELDQYRATVRTFLAHNLIHLED